jgi:hypothetical protein
MLTRELNSKINVSILTENSLNNDDSIEDIKVSELDRDFEDIIVDLYLQSDDGLKQNDMSTNDDNCNYLQDLEIANSEEFETNVMECFENIS